MNNFSYRWFEWDEEDSSEGDAKLGVKQSEKKLTPLEDVDQQLALAFNNDGSALASGGEVYNMLYFTHILILCIGFRWVLLGLISR